MALAVCTVVDRLGRRRQAAKAGSPCIGAARLWGLAGRCSNKQSAASSTQFISVYNKQGADNPEA